MFLNENFLKKNISSSWYNALKSEFKKQYFNDLSTFLEHKYNSTTVYPKKENIFLALKESSIKEIKAVVLGQDPYHGPNQAIGFSFAVPDEHNPKPPSLKNIFKELKTDLNVINEPSSCLLAWRNQGVFLLNKTLTVEKKKPNSHKKSGWSILTSKILEILTEKQQPCVFILWGQDAKNSLKPFVNIKKNHLIISSPHPSPLSCYRGFWGSKPFSKANKFLESHNTKPINWI